MTNDTILYEDDVAQGIETSTLYIVQYDEDLWHSFGEESKQFCKDTWIRKAEPTGVEEVVLRLVPDPIFPGFGKEKPYIEWRHKFPKDLGGEWQEVCVVSLCTNDNRDRLDVSGQATMRKHMAKYPKGTKFMVYNLQRSLLWETNS